MKLRFIFSLLFCLGCLVAYSAPEKELKADYSVSIDQGSDEISDNLDVTFSAGILAYEIFIDRCSNEFDEVNLNLPANPSLKDRFSAYRPRSATPAINYR